MPVPSADRMEEYARKGVELLLRTLGEAPEQRAARRLSAQHRPAEATGPRVLIVSPRDWAAHVQYEAVIGHALRLRGADVHVATCGGGLEICLACVEGRLAETPVRWRRQSAVTVVMASLNYPNTYPTGMEISGVDKAEATGCLVYHAGTKVHNGKLYTNGGRVFAITSLGRTVEQASHLAYDGLSNIQFNGMQFRQDIGRPLPPQRAKRGRPPVSPVSGVGRSGQSWKSAGRHTDSPLNRPPQPDRSSKGRNNRGGSQGRRGG